MKVKVIVEEHVDGFLAYPVGLKGVVVAQGDTYAEALTNVESAIRFHIDTFGSEGFSNEETALQVFVAETAIAV